MKYKIIVAAVSAALLNGCATLEEEMQAKYGVPLKVVNYNNDTYKVAVNSQKREIVVKENDGVAEKLFSPKYGALGVLIDATEVLGRDEEYRGVADDYLSKTQSGCKTISGYIEKCNMECYEFQYACNVIAKKDEIKPSTNSDPIKIITPEIQSLASMPKQNVVSFHGIDIKGIYLGMTNDQVTEKIGASEFTVAGIKSKYSNLHLDFHDGKLDQLIFFFHPTGFDNVLDAVKGKYPLLKCENSTVSNAMGASFPQTRCEFGDSESLLILSRVIDIKTSALSLVSKRRLAEEERRKTINKQDI